MLLRLFLLFTLVPLLELAVLVEVGRHVGLVATLAVVLGTGIVGAWLARLQGLKVLAAVQRELAGGRLPAEELLGGLLILLAGALLLTPGLVTDLCGLLLLVPPGRALAPRMLASWLRRRLQPGGPAVIEAVFRRE